MVTDGTGTLVELAEYRPYGALARREGPVEVPQKFTGQRLDATGLYFYNARYYDPALGRFISPDPFVQAPDDPQLLNRYSYVRNNPLKFTDPSGHFLNFLIAAIVAIAISATVELAIQAFDLHGGAAKTLRFLGALVSGGVGGSIAGLTGQALGNTIAAAGATSLTLDTGEGRQLTRSVSKRFVQWGVSSRAAAILGAAVTGTAVSVGYGVAFSQLTTPVGVTQQEITPQEYLNSEHYADLRAGEGASGGFWGRGSNVSKTAQAAHARVFELSRNGQPIGVLATAPLFGDVPILRHVARALQINHSAFVGYRSTGGTINSMLSLSSLEYATTAVCHTCTLIATSNASVPTASVLSAIGPSGVISSLLYGLSGGSTAYYAGRTAVESDR